MAERDGQTADYQALRRILEGRFSCRAFRPEPVPRSIIEAMLTAAQRTASWCNAQPWQVIVLSGPALQRLAAALHAHAAQGGAVEPDIAFPSTYEGVYRDRRRACGYALYESVGIGRDDRAAGHQQMLENFRFFGAPHAALITCASSLGPYAAIDCGGYVANVLNAAQSLGLGAVPQAAIASHPDIIRAHVDIPASHTLVCGIAFGFADRDHPVNGFRTARAGLREAVRWMDD